MWRRRKIEVSKKEVFSPLLNYVHLSKVRRIQLSFHNEYKDLKIKER